MQQIGVIIWSCLLTTSAVMGITYLWCTLSPGAPEPSVFAYFSQTQIEQGRAYSQLMRISYIASFAAQCFFLAWLAFSGRSSVISQHFDRSALSPVIVSLFSFAVLWLMLQLISLPFTYFSSFVVQHHWGLSTQTAGSWFSDYLKSAGIELLLAGAGAIILFKLMMSLPRLWWFATAILLSVWIVAASYLWPVVVSPLFNRFTPSDNPAISDMVKRLADKADIPVNEVLIMDASKRTNRTNAYFAGVGNTRRVVLYDTLLRDYPLDEVESVVAHEAAHWRQSHIVKGMLWGILGSILGWGALQIVLRSTLPTVAVPHVWVYILLFFYLGSFVTLPLQNAISQQMEREADLIAVSLTQNPQAAIRLQINLAVKNLSDVAPAKYLRLFSTHPPAIERITAISAISR